MGLDPFPTASLSSVRIVGTAGFQPAPLTPMRSENVLQTQSRAESYATVAGLVRERVMGRLSVAHTMLNTCLTMKDDPREKFVGFYARYQSARQWLFRSVSQGLLNMLDPETAGLHANGASPTSS
jgi:hypothetical protein